MLPVARRFFARVPEDSLRRSRWLLGAALLLAPAGVALVCAYQRRWLDDDGFINLRIVRNLLDGYGPVFNLDERVEAGTSPLWLYLIMLLGALGVRLEDASVYTGILLTGASLLLAQDAATRLHAPAGERLPTRVGRLWLPLGALTVAVLPPVWDYASGGLETGLSLVWLAAAYDALVFELSTGTEARPLTRGRLARACLLGLGILIRPELSLYALAFFLLFGWVCVRAAGSARERLVRALALGVAFGLLPLAYQLFRMGYYGVLGPNTAIAKEAFLVNWEQGRCYLRNFVNPYKLRQPLLLLALLLAWLGYELVRKRENARGTETRSLLLLAALLPPSIAAVHAFYVVRMGGDYMHARMLLPAAFAALLPVAAVPMIWPSRAATVLSNVCGAAVLAWCVQCASSFRVPVENQCDVGDERGWYARIAEVPNPVRLEDYEKHMFHDWGRDLVNVVKGPCPALELASEQTREPGCRLLHVSGDEARELYPMRTSYPLAEETDRRLLGVVSQGAIGIAGFMLPERVHLADMHGLADPFVARVVLRERGRPGHEKTMPIAWRLARYTTAVPGEDASVAAARHALSCGALATLDRAVRGPLTFGQFFDNVSHALEHSRMRIPADPFNAEARYCGGPRFTFLDTPGEGGDQFHWRCPGALGMTAIRGAVDAPSSTLARLVGECADPAGTGRGPQASPAYGSDAGTPFALHCPGVSQIVGIFGSADKVVHSLGLVCSDGTRSRVAGLTGGPPFELLCPAGESVRTLRGRAGSLLDAIGIGCSKQDPHR